MRRTPQYDKATPEQQPWAGTRGIDHRLARCAVILVALLLTAWFGVMLRNDLMAHAASDRLVDNPEMSSAEWDQAMDDLRSAEWLNPSNEWRMIRGQYLLWRDKPEAARLAASVLRDEPDSLNAWWLLVRATAGWAPERAAHASTEIRRLNPAPPRARP